MESVDGGEPIGRLEVLRGMADFADHVSVSDSGHVAVSVGLGGVSLEGQGKLGQVGLVVLKRALDGGISDSSEGSNSENLEFHFLIIIAAILI